MEIDGNVKLLTICVKMQLFDKGEKALRSMLSIIIGLFLTSAEAYDYEWKKSMSESPPILHPISGSPIYHPSPQRVAPPLVQLDLEDNRLENEPFNSLIAGDDRWLLAKMLFPCFSPIFNVFYYSRG